MCLTLNSCHLCTQKFVLLPSTYDMKSQNSLFKRMRLNRLLAFIIHLTDLWSYFFYIPFILIKAPLHRKFQKNQFFPVKNIIRIPDDIIRIPVLVPVHIIRNPDDRKSTKLVRFITFFNNFRCCTCSCSSPV